MLIASIFATATEGLQTAQVDWWALAIFCPAAVLVGTLDISLPRGDSVGVGGALDVVALLVVGPIEALVVSCIGTIAAAFIRRKESGFSRLGPIVAVRLLALASAVLLNKSAAEYFGSKANPASLVPAAATVVVFLLVELVGTQAVASWSGGRSFSGLVRGNLSWQLPLIMAQLSASLLAVVVYSTLSLWSVALVVVLLILIRQSYALLLDIRETYLTTVEVLVEAAEGCDEQRRGHAERTAFIAREIAGRCDLSSKEVERVSYAALLHDLNGIRYSDNSGEVTPSAASVVAGVRFFDDLMGILRLCDGTSPMDTVPVEADLFAAFIVALASDIDCATRAGLDGSASDMALLRLSHLVPANQKARAVSSAVLLGYRIPAVA